MNTFSPSFYQVRWTWRVQQMLKDFSSFTLPCVAERLHSSGFTLELLAFHRELLLGRGAPAMSKTPVISVNALRC